jgi:hypothetical protein
MPCPAVIRPAGKISLLEARRLIKNALKISNYRLPHL